MAFAGADDVDGLHVGEMIYVQHLTNGDAVGRAAEFADESLGLAIGLGQRFDARLGFRFGPLAVEPGNVTTLAAIGQTPGFVAKTQLHRLVAVTLDRAQLQHVTGPGLNYRDGNGIAVVVENLCHPDLAAEQSGWHRSVSCGRVAEREHEAQGLALPATASST